MKRLKLDTDTYTKLELEERKATMETYRIGAFGCMNEVPEYQIGDKWDEVKSDLNFDASFQPELCAQVHQLNILEQRNTDLGLFNEIMEWIQFHSNRDDSVKWGSAEFLSRKRVLGKIEQCMKTTHLKLQMSKVNLLSRQGWATVPTYDFPQTVLSMVHDETIMREENSLPKHNWWNGKHTLWGKTKNQSVDALLNLQKYAKLQV